MLQYRAHLQGCGLVGPQSSEAPVRWDDVHDPLLILYLHVHQVNCIISMLLHIHVKDEIPRSWYLLFQSFQVQPRFFVHTSHPGQN